MVALPERAGRPAGAIHTSRPLRRRCQLSREASARELAHLGEVARDGIAADGLGVAAVTALRVAALGRRVATLGRGLRPLLLLGQATALLDGAEADGRLPGLGLGERVAIALLEVAGVRPAAVAAGRLRRATLGEVVPALLDLGAVGLAAGLLVLDDADLVARAVLLLAVRLALLDDVGHVAGLGVAAAGLRVAAVAAIGVAALGGRVAALRLGLGLRPCGVAHGVPVERLDVAAVGRAAVAAGRLSGAA